MVDRAHLRRRYVIGRALANLGKVGELSMTQRSK